MRTGFPPGVVPDCCYGRRCSSEEDACSARRGRLFDDRHGDGGFEGHPGPEDGDEGLGEDGEVFDEVHEVHEADEVDEARSEGYQGSETSKDGRQEAGKGDKIDVESEVYESRQACAEGDQEALTVLISRIHTAQPCGCAEFLRQKSEDRTMQDPMKPEFTVRNPIVEAATRIRARRQIEAAIDADSGAPHRVPDDAETALRLFAKRLQEGCMRLNAIVGPNRARVVVLERPLRLRVRFGEKRVALDLDDVHQLVRVAGLDLDGEFQFDPGAAVPSLVNLSKISTESGYGEAVTPSSLLKRIAAGAELPPPDHLRTER
jgi:hypothetical protein